jgi:ABC-type antimicrobial peptide transport system permease subunit
VTYKPYYYGYLKHIYISKSKIIELCKVENKGTDGYKNLISSILNVINQSVDNFWKFEIVQGASTNGKSTISIVDKNTINLSMLQQIYTFELGSTNNVIKNINFDVSLTNEQATNVLFSNQNSTYNIAVKVRDLKQMGIAIGEATATFRPVRKLGVKDADNFFIDKSDSIAESLLKNLGFLEKGTIGIAFITLIGAAIGLMNIMLVAVNERTKEIGLAKALGATASAIKSQFLFESVLISLMGAVVGIVTGILLGNVVAVFLHTGLIIPWAWVGSGIVVCFVVGLFLDVACSSYGCWLFWFRVFVVAVSDSSRYDCGLLVL